MYDVCIIGGGAAGMMAAVSAAEMEKSVILIEKNEKLGKKLYATGNGKANVTNSYMEYDQVYYSSDPQYVTFLQDAFGRESNKTVIDLLKQIGVLTYENPHGYVYPVSNQASSVCFAFVERLKQLQVEVSVNSLCQNIEYTKEKNFSITISDVKTKKNITISAKNCILACGGCSYKSLGGSAFGYDIAKKLGHNIEELKPSLCKIYPDNDEILKIANGVRASVKIKVICKSNGREHVIRQEEGELQITEKGLSGIVIFNMVSCFHKLIKKNNDIYFKIDFVPHISEEALFDLYNRMNYRCDVGFLNGFLNDKLAKYFLLQHKDMRAEETVKALIHQIKNQKFFIRKTGTFDEAQVTSGGVKLSEISCKDFQSSIVPGLYIVGELLDVDGICGGYNLTHAFLSGYKAGKSIHD